MVNISLKEDEARYVMETLLKRLEGKKLGPTPSKITMTNNIWKKMKKGFKRNKHSPVFGKIIAKAINNWLDFLRQKEAVKQGTIAARKKK
jgi:hypothetical protein